MVRLLPGLTVLAGYRRTWLRGDVIAGITVAAYLIPQVMAYAGVAGLPPVAGLWAIVPALLLYAVFGSSRQLSVGPESTTALMTALIIAPLAAGARAFANRGDMSSDIDANQELLALGSANLGAGLLSGFPVSSSGSRTAVGDAAGSRTQLYSLVALVWVLATLLFLGPLLARFPIAALGGIVVYAATRLIDVRGFRRLAAFRRSELLLALAALGGVLVLDILYGVLVAVALSVAEMLARVARPHDAILGVVPGLAGMHDVDDYPQARTTPGLVVYRYDSPLFFANAEDFRRRALAAVDEQPEPVTWFILNTEANVEVDITALEAVDAVRRDLERRGIVFALARVKRDLLDDLDAFGLTASVGPERIFPTLPTAVAAYEDWRRKSDV
jgi:MFS superfamily sulfate permease-like transporter